LCQNTNLKTYEWLAEFAEKTETIPSYQKVWRELMDYIPEVTWRNINYDRCSNRTDILYYLNQDGYNMVHILNVVMYRKIFC